ncbi:MAG: hypothetical protein ACO3N4_01325 [Ilumatobacteraceae bacterium]
MTDRRIMIAAALAMLAGRALSLARRIAPTPDDDDDDEPDGLPDEWHDIDDALPMLESGVFVVHTHGSTFWRYMYTAPDHWSA